VTFKLIPAIDIIDGQLVRLYKGDYGQVTQYQKTPLAMAQHYQAMGLKHIHVVDLNGAKGGQLVNLTTIQSIIKATDLTVQVGGGVRSPEHIEDLLSIGVSAIIIGSLLVHDFELATHLIHAFPHKIIAGLDVQGDHIAAHGWTETSDISLADMLKKLAGFPLNSIVTTDIQKDGTFEGPNVKLYQQMSQLTNHNVIASGGVASINDITTLAALKVPQLQGCIVGKAIIEGRINPADTRAFQ